MNIDKQIDIIFHEIDQLCSSNNFNEVDNILNNIDIENTTTNLLIAYLSITFPAKKHLKHRDYFYSKIFKKFALTEKYDSKRLFGLIGHLN